MAGLGGFGKGLSDIGQMLFQWGLQRDSAREDRAWRTQQEALDRALRTQESERQATRDQALASLYQGQNEDRVRDNERQDADLITKYFGGQEIPGDVVAQIPERFRGVLVEEKGRTGTVMEPELAGMTSAINVPEKVTMIRQPVTSGERIADTNAAARLSAETLRQNYLMRKLSQDRELAGITDATRRAQIDAQLKAAGDRVAATYASIDARLAEAAYEAEADAIIEKFKAENRQQGGGFNFFMMPGGGAAPGAPPASSTPVAAPKMPAPPTRPGAPPPATDPADPMGLGLRKRTP